MPASSVTDLFAPDGTPDKLHVCLLDPAGDVRVMNYRVPEGTTSDLPDLIRAAYGVQPHPDMPDGIYARMEERLDIHAGSAGYYICEAPDGATFWIAVSFYKTENGRVVCHFPVTSPKLAYFARSFAHLKQAERDGKDPKEIAAGLVDLMVRDGVTDYRTLATSIMIEEIGKRDQGRNRPQYCDLLVLKEMLKTLHAIDASGRKITEMSERSKLIPYQLKLQAARLEGGRGPFSVIAENHQALTAKLLQVTADLQAGSATEIDAVIDAIAYIAQSNHAVELVETRFVTQAGDAAQAQTTLSELKAVIRDCEVQRRTLLADIDRSVLALGRICRRMRRALSAMEMTRMICKIERANLASGGEGLEDTEHQLQHVERSLSTWIDMINDNSKTALALVEKMNSTRQTQAA